MTGDCECKEPVLECVCVRKFKKKPIIIQAVQWFPKKSVDGVYRTFLDNLTLDFDYAWINTLEGKMKVSPGDWIITGVNGEKYPCKPDIFDKTYESVE